MVGAWFVLGGDDGPESERPPATSKADTGRANTGETDTGRAEAKQETRPEKPEPILPEMSCPAGLTNCEVATGRIIYVEAVDPDGDGDAHFVTASKQGVTLPGITIFDVRPELRPNPLPGRGDLVGGYGPVYEGSHGQKQIEVIEFHVGK